MSAFPESGRSGTAKTTETKGRFRPEDVASSGTLSPDVADVAVAIGPDNLTLQEQISLTNSSGARASTEFSGSLSYSWSRQWEPAMASILLSKVVYTAKFRTWGLGGDA